MLERALNAPPRFSRRRFLATSSTASLAFALASQPERLSAEGTATESSGSNGGNPNTVVYAGYLKSDPSGISALTGQDFWGHEMFYDSIEILNVPASFQMASPNAYNPLNLTPPPLVEINYTDVELVIVGMGPAISGRPGTPNFAPASNLINETGFLIFPAILTKYTETPVVAGVPQTQYKSPVEKRLLPLMLSSDFPSGSTKLDVNTTPPVWAGNPVVLNKLVGPHSIWVDNISKATAPLGSSFEVTGTLGSTCGFTAKLTLSAPQQFSGFTIGPFGFSTVTAPAKVYTTTFQWTFGIVKWNTVTGVWDVLN